MQSSLRFGIDEWRLAYRVALRILRAPDQAEDAAQEALLMAFQARDSFAGRARPTSWLYRIAHNTALSHLRAPVVRRRADGAIDELLDGADRFGEPHGAIAPSPIESAVGDQLAGDLDDSLSRLSDLDRLAFTQRYLLGATEQELGRILGVSSHAARQRAFRARRAVRRSLEAKWNHHESG